MARIPARIPAPLSGRTGSGAETFMPDGYAFDVAIGGMPFLLAVNPERPLLRALAEIRKDQIDQQEIPGEQSLADWWLRSQSTFIGGAGLLYQDPDVANRYAIQYGSSTGLSPWENGRLSLLKRTALDIAEASANAHHVVGYNDGTDRYWSAAGTALNSSTGSATTAVTWGGSGTILSLATDGTDYYVADSTGIYSGTGAGAGALAWNTGSSNVVLGWAMGRLMAGIGASIYELAGGTPPALPSPVMTHLASGWRWTAITEGTSAIYAAGYSGSKSAIYKFVLDADGSVPVLATGGIQAAQLPHGEVVLSMSAYLGTYVGIGTSRGFRVGQIDEGGDIVYGPLVFEVADGVRGMVGYDRFFFVAASNAIEGESGLYRVDLGQVNEDQGPSSSIRYAYATDLQAHVDGVVDSVTLLGNSPRPVFTVRESGSYVEHASELEGTGTFLTGRVRYNTLTEKIFRFVTVRNERPLSGRITASVIDPTGGQTNVITVSGSAAIENILLRTPVTTAEWLQLRLTLSRDEADATAGPAVTGWQFKALPGEIRQRTFTLPLLAFDFESDRYGNQHGWEGRTLSRLEAFERIIQRGDVISYQDLRTNTTTQVVVDDDRYEFRQATPPGMCEGWGGYIYIRLRTVTDSIT